VTELGCPTLSHISLLLAIPKTTTPTLSHISILLAIPKTTIPTLSHISLLAKSRDMCDRVGVVKPVLGIARGSDNYV
jgi:hypothetical protein